MRKREGEVHATASTSRAVEFAGRRLKPGDWKPFGDDIEGEASDEQSGYRVVMSADGKRVAVVATLPRDGGYTDGQVRIFQLKEGRWTKIGEAIIDERRENSQVSVAMSADGSRIAIGAASAKYYDGVSAFVTLPARVRIFDLDLAETTWTMVGEEIAYELTTSLFVAMSADGSRVAAGSRASVNGDYSGYVSIYDVSKTPFTQFGDDIDGESGGDQSGWSVAMSADGSRVAIGAPYNDGINGENSGHVRVYDLSKTPFTKVGDDIDGESGGDKSGYSVAMSADGSRVVIGVKNNEGINGVTSGHVRIFDLDGTAWNQIGEDIDGEASADYSGSSVAISADGSRVAVGAPFNVGTNGYAGHVRIYDLKCKGWTQFGQDLDGEAPSDFFGESVAMSADGSRVAIGARGNDNNGNDWAGHVRLYKVCGLQYP
jgi:hypothetical protein